MKAAFWGFFYVLTVRLIRSNPLIAERMREIFPSGFINPDKHGHLNQIM